MVLQAPPSHDEQVVLIGPGAGSDTTDCCGAEIASSGASALGGSLAKIVIGGSAAVGGSVAKPLLLRETGLAFPVFAAGPGGNG
jgi:hypothetical protein